MKSILALLLLTQSAVADTAFYSFGAGVIDTISTKIGNIGYRRDLIDGIFLQGKIGAWIDASGLPGKTGSIYASTGPGILVNLRPIEIRNSWSLAAITSPDSQLGGIFPQFNGELYIGVRDRKGNGIGIQFEHVSSAGILNPNLGRDFLVIQVSQSW